MVLIHMLKSKKNDFIFYTRNIRYITDTMADQSRQEFNNALTQYFHARRDAGVPVQDCLLHQVLYQPAKSYDLQTFVSNAVRYWTTDDPEILEVRPNVSAETRDKFIMIAKLMQDKLNACI